MKIVFDPAKDPANIAKHGVSLGLAGSLEWELMQVEEDGRFEYGETRMQGFAPIGTKVFCVVFTEDDDCYRIVSLRRATRPEVRNYASQI